MLAGAHRFNEPFHFHKAALRPLVPNCSVESTSSSKVKKRLVAEKKNTLRPVDEHQISVPGCLSKVSHFYTSVDTHVISLPTLICVKFLFPTSLRQPKLASCLNIIAISSALR